MEEINSENKMDYQLYCDIKKIIELKKRANSILNSPELQLIKKVNFSLYYDIIGNVKKIDDSLPIIEISNNISYSKLVYYKFKKVLINNWYILVFFLIFYFLPYNIYLTI